MSGYSEYKLIVAGDGLIQDAVMTGLDREYIELSYYWI